MPFHNLYWQWTNSSLIKWAPFAVTSIYLSSWCQLVPPASLFHCLLAKTLCSSPWQRLFYLFILPTLETAVSAVLMHQSVFLSDVQSDQLSNRPRHPTLSRLPSWGTREYHIYPKPSILILVSSRSLAMLFCGGYVAKPEGDPSIQDGETRRCNCNWYEDNCSFKWA